MSELKDIIARLENQLAEETPFVPRAVAEKRELAARSAGMRDAAKMVRGRRCFTTNDRDELIDDILARADELEREER